MKHFRLFSMISLSSALVLGGCSFSGQTASPVSDTILSETESLSDSAEISADSDAAAASEDSEASDTFEYLDAQGQYHFAELQDWKLSDYQTELFSVEGSSCSYTGDDRYTYSLGIDVSAYQGNVDWSKVKAAGYDFAFLRIGYRGYGEVGNIKEDSCFLQNYRNAKAAGMDLGIYFFSQAVNEEEAIEEADFVLTLLSSYGISPEDLALPIVFDPETILNDTARTDNVTGEQFTQNTLAFYKEIEAQGYTSMIFCNMVWEADMLDLSLLQDHEVWYADYLSKPQTPYAFSYWQYSESSSVDGVDGPVDTDIRLIPLAN